MNIFYAVFLCLFTEYGSSKNIPSFVHLCKRRDPALSKCFNNTIYEMIPYMVNGIPEMDIAPIDPMAFTTVAVNTGTATAVSVEVELFNGTVIGLQHLDIKKLEIDIDSVRCSIAMNLPYMRLQTNYKIRGKILFFEIDSMGRADVNATDQTYHIEWYGSRYLDKGKQYIRIDKLDISEMRLGNMVLKLEDSDKERQPFMEIVTKAINDNMESLIQELGALVKETLNNVFISYYNKVCRLFPEDELFPKN